MLTGINPQTKIGKLYILQLFTTRHDAIHSTSNEITR